MFHSEAGAIFMWTAPQPAWNQTVQGTDPANIQTAVIRVLNGSKNFHVRWKYTLLPGQRILLSTFAITNGILWDDFGFIFNPGSSSEKTENSDKDDYNIRFSVTASSEFSSVTIHTVTERENATFQCRLLISGNVWAYNIQIFVTVSPKITYISDDRMVNKGDVLSLKCTADGTPAPKITWTRISDNSSITFPLTITGKQDEGIYRCTADNGFGSRAQRDVFVSFPNPPEIIKPKTVAWEITAGESAFIKCHALGNPSPQYVWRNAAGRVVTTDKHLRLHKVNDSHGGSYTCTATNSMGSANFTILVRIASTSSRKPTASSPTTHATPENELRTTSSDDSAWIIMGAAVGGALVLVIIVALVLWWMRRDTTIVKEEIEDDHCVHEAAGHQNIPHYAVVTKPQNGKKRRRPGEVLYADLENFSRQEMPTVNTSQNPLPPVKRPTPYVKTDYAEIAHFMKVEPNGMQASDAISCKGWDEDRETIM